MRIVSFYYVRFGEFPRRFNTTPTGVRNELFQHKTFENTSRSMIFPKAFLFYRKRHVAFFLFSHNYCDRNTFNWKLPTENGIKFFVANFPRFNLCFVLLLWSFIRRGMSVIALMTPSSVYRPGAFVRS